MIMLLSIDLGTFNLAGYGVFLADLYSVAA